MEDFRCANEETGNQPENCETPGGFGRFGRTALRFELISEKTKLLFLDNFAILLRSSLICLQG